MFCLFEVHLRLKLLAEDLHTLPVPSQPMASPQSHLPPLMQSSRKGSDDQSDGIMEAGLVEDPPRTRISCTCAAQLS